MLRDFSPSALESKFIKFLYKFITILDFNKKQRKGGCSIATSPVRMGSLISKDSEEPEDPPIETPIAKNVKICVIGPKSVGKSCFVQRYVKGGFTPAYSPDTTGSLKNALH